MIPIAELTGVVASIVEDVRRTEVSYRELHSPDRPVQPLPFFGDVRSAQVITVGVNPSAEEFASERGWQPEPMSAEALTMRLLGYFDSGHSHPWFEGWRHALRAAHIDSLPWAHIDLSPRATYSFGRFTMGPSASATAKASFLSMIKHDLSHFEQVLNLCGEARLILLAGGVTNIYMDDYLGKHFSQGSRFPEGKRKVGAAPVTRLELRVGTSWVRGLFVGVGPSRKTNWAMLANRVAENRSYLQAALSL